MNISEVKELITARTGVPAEILTGGSETELFSQAADYLNRRPKTARESFSEFLTGEVRESESLTAVRKEISGIESSRQELRDKISSETGVPAHLLTGGTEEEIRVQAEAIRAYSEPKYPVIRDGGEFESHYTASPKDAFADWMSTNFAYRG